MRLTRNSLVFKELDNEQKKEIRKDGSTSVIDQAGNEVEVFIAPTIVSYSSDGANGENFITVRQIALGENVVSKGDTDLIVKVQNHDEIRVLYRVDVSIASVLFASNIHYFTELEEVIDFYNKVEPFLKKLD